MKTSIDELLSDYEMINVSDERLISMTERYMSTMGDSQVRCILHILLNKFKSNLYTHVIESQVRMWKCFEDVAFIIGVDAAVIELTKVLESKNLDVFTEETLENAFTWKDTPQGYHFWSNIDHGDCPLGIK